MIHIGQEIKDTLSERKMPVVQLAQALGCHRSNIYNLLGKASMDTKTLEHLSLILHRNFFQIYADEIEGKMKEK